MINNNDQLNLAIIGLGYVGLPLALEIFQKKNVIGFDINKIRIKELKSGIDKNLEFDIDQLNKFKGLKYTNRIEDLKSVNCFIVTVPTPVDNLKKPDLTPLLKATKMIGQIMKLDDLIIYESTVYPGCIEEECMPILEKIFWFKI